MTDSVPSFRRSGFNTLFGSLVSAIPFVQYLEQHEHMTRQSFDTLKTVRADLVKVQEEHDRVEVELARIRGERSSRA